MISKDDVLEGMARLTMHYPEAGHTEETLTVLAEDILEDMVDIGVGAAEFRQAIKSCRRSCQYMPKPSNIIKAVNDIREQAVKLKIAKAEKKALPAYGDISQERLAKNSEAVGVLARILDGELTEEEGSAQIEKITGVSCAI